MKSELEKIAIALKDLKYKHALFIITITYKLKAKKVRLINTNNGIGEGLRGRPNWFIRSKAREYP